MKYTFGIAASILSLALSSSAFADENPLKGTQKTPSLFQQESVSPKTNFDLSVGSRSDFLSEDTNENYGTIGGVFSVNVNPLFAEVDGYYGTSYTQDEELEKRKNVSSLNGKIGGSIASGNEMFQLMPFLGYGFENQWVAEENQNLSWVGPFTGIAFAVAPIEKLNMKVSYSHHFLDYKKQITEFGDADAVDASLFANAHAEKVGLELNYVLAKAIDIGLGATYQYFYKHKNTGQIKGTATHGDEVLKIAESRMATPALKMHGILASARATYRF